MGLTWTTKRKIRLSKSENLGGPRLMQRNGVLKCREFARLFDARFDSPRQKSQPRENKNATQARVESEERPGVEKAHTSSVRDVSKKVSRRVIFLGSDLSRAGYITEMKSVFRNDIFAGRTAFITGGGSGICMGIAEALMAHGADVAIVSRKAERLAESATKLQASTGKKCIPIAADVRDPKAVEAALDTALAALGRLDIVVNGAAGNFLAPASQLSYNAFKTVIEIDTIGTFNVSRAAFEKWLRDHGGVLLNISATLHYGATPLQAHASAAKAAVDSLTRSLALEWGSSGIRVVGIAPGPIDDTEGMRRLAPGEMKDRFLKSIPIGRFGTVAEIANLAVFLCSDAASLVHGETVVADGGAWLGSSGFML